MNKSILIQVFMSLPTNLFYCFAIKCLALFHFHSAHFLNFFALFNNIPLCFIDLCQLSTSYKCSSIESFVGIFWNPSVLSLHPATYSTDMTNWRFIEIDLICFLSIEKCHFHIDFHWVWATHIFTPLFVLFQTFLLDNTSLLIDNPTKLWKSFTNNIWMIVLN